MASGSTFPAPPEHYKLCADGALEPPPPPTGPYTVFGETQGADVAIPKPNGRDLLQYNADGSVGACAVLFATAHWHAWQNDLKCAMWLVTFQDISLHLLHAVQTSLPTLCA